MREDEVHLGQIGLSGFSGVDSVNAASNAVAVGESVTVVALPDPSGQSFPGGYPTWSPSGSVGATSSVTISTAGTNTVRASCGTSSKSTDVIGVGLTNLSGVTKAFHREPEEES